MIRGYRKVFMAVILSLVFCTSIIGICVYISSNGVYSENEIGELKFDSDEEDAIYRVIQESITNSIRHGKSTKIYVTLYFCQKELLEIILVRF